MPRPHARHVLRAACLALLTTAALPAAAQYYGEAVPYGPPYNASPYNAPPPPPPGAYGPWGRGAPPVETGYRRGPWGADSYGRTEAYPEARRLRPREVVERLEDMGYEDVGRPRFTGTLYLVEATAPGDVRVQVVVDAVRGVVLNRTAIGPQRNGREVEAEDDDVRPRQYGRVEPYVLPPDAPPPPPADERRPRRDAARPGAPALPPAPPVAAPPPVVESPLPPPADPRLAPGGPEASRPFEGRSDPRRASRAEQPAARPAPADPQPAKPYGLNPEAAPARKPAEMARRPVTPHPTPQAAAPPQPAAPAPGRKREEARPAGTPTTAQAEAATPARPNKPVRVIGGVTPMTAPPSPAPGGGADQLDTLPAPPAVPPPSM